MFGLQQSVFESRIIYLLFSIKIYVFSFVSGAISKSEVSIDETLHFDVVVKYSLSSVVLSNPFSIPLKYCGWVRQCLMALRQSGDREIEGIM